VAGHAGIEGEAEEGGGCGVDAADVVVAGLVVRFNRSSSVTSRRFACNGIGVGTPRPGYYEDRYAYVKQNGKCYIHPSRSVLPGKSHCVRCKEYYRDRYNKAKASGKCHTHPSVDAVAGEKSCSACLWRQIAKSSGWTRDEYEKAYKAQDGKCALCSVPGEMVATSARPLECLVGDHCHATGKIRGLLCTACNRSVGFFGEDASRIERFAANVSSYLARFGDG